MPSSRDQIIATTCDLIELQGYHATGLNQIIAESGCPKGSLYYYFPGGKEALAAEAVQQAGRIVLERIRSELAQTDDPAQAIGAFITNVARHVEESGFRAGGPITTLAMETASTHAGLREVCEGIYTAWQDAFAEKLLAGGLAEPRARRLAAFIVASLEGGVIFCRTRQSRQPLEWIAEEIGAVIKTG